MRDGFKIIDADRHVMEPADLWERYLVAYPAFADNFSGLLPSRLRRLTQPVMSPPNRFSTPLLPRLVCL
jgi:uncharacterized protein